MDKGVAEVTEMFWICVIIRVAHLDANVSFHEYVYGVAKVVIASDGLRTAGISVNSENRLETVDDGCVG